MAHHISDTETPAVAQAGTGQVEASDPSRASSLRDHVVASLMGVLFFCVLMLLPIWLVYYYVSLLAVDIGKTPTAGAAVVGVGAILRSVSRNVLRTSMGVASRTAARTLSRHWSETVVHWLESVFKSSKTRRQHTGQPHPLISIAVGATAVGISYCGVLWLVDDSVRGLVLGESSMFTAFVVAMLPLLLYFFFAFMGGRLFNVRVTPRTEIDGLLLQLYFTFAGSFLPLTSDGEYHGRKRDKAFAALFALGSLFFVHLALQWIATASGSPLVSHLSVLCLIYTFVLALPMHPLDGSEIWAQNKLAWLIFFGVLLAAFNFSIPEAFYDLM